MSLRMAVIERSRNNKFWKQILASTTLSNRTRTFSLKSNIFPLISSSKQMSEMYIDRWHSAEQCLKCTLKPESQRSKFSLLKASLRGSKRNLVCSRRGIRPANEILFKNVIGELVSEVAKA